MSPGDDRKVTNRAYPAAAKSAGVSTARVHTGYKVPPNIPTTAALAPRIAADRTDQDLGVGIGDGAGVPPITGAFSIT